MYLRYLGFNQGPKDKLVQASEAGSTEAHFTDDVSPVIQIISIAVIQLLDTKALQHFTHVTTVQLACHLPNFVVIPGVKFG